MDGEPWKISPPKSHPSNPVHKAAMKEQNKEVPISSNFLLTSRRSLSDHKSRHRQWSLCEQFFWQVCWFGRVNFSAWRTVPSERRPQQELTAKCVPPERRCLALSCNVENWSSRSSRWGRAKETLGFFLQIFFRPFPKSLLSADRLIASMWWEIILFSSSKTLQTQWTTQGFTQIISLGCSSTFAPWWTKQCTAAAPVLWTPKTMCSLRWTKKSGSENTKCHAFTISKAQKNMMDKQLESVQH